MKWDSDDAFKLYFPCGILFALGFLAKLFGIVGFLIGAGLAFLVARYIAVWIRERFEIKSATPEDRLDLAMRQNTIIEAVEVLTKGKARP